MSDQKEYLQDEIEKINAIQSMCRTRGWKILKDHFEIVVKAINERLVVADINDVIRLQERLKAFREMTKVAEDFGAMREMLTKELDDIKLEESFLRKYSLS